jgi:Fic family protein
MKISQFKSGKYISNNLHAYCYKYFLPEKINQPIDIDNSKLQVQLERSTRLLGELNAMALMVKNIDLFIMGFINSEATLSSKIEGTQTNIEDSFKGKQEVSIEKKDDWEEVMLYIKAINYSIDALQELPLSTRLIKKTHKILLSSGRGKHKMPGEFRISQNWIGGNSIEEADFIPPHHTYINELMSDLEKFIHSEFLIPDIIKIAIAHYQFETIHPFCDGNGRIGRMLIPLYLVHKKILSKPLLYMSAFFEANKQLYYDTLTKVRDNNNITEWLLFFLKGVEQTSLHSINTLKTTLELRENLLQKIHTSTGSRSNNNSRMLEQLFLTPFVTIDNVAKKLNVSTTTAKNIVDDLVRIKILTELTKQKRNRLFAFAPYLNLINKPFPKSS